MQPKPKLKAYIAGAVSGFSFNMAYEKFKCYQTLLESQGYEVVNPVTRLVNVNSARMSMNAEPLEEETHRKEIMGICLLDLSQCDELHLLPDWVHSKGANLERHFAMAHKMPIVYL